MPAAERMRRMRARRKAEGFKAVVEWKAVEPLAIAPYSSHRMHEARSLAMHTVIAQMLMRDPEVLRHARANLARWSRSNGRPKPDWVNEWQALLDLPRRELAALLSEPSERGARLRQSSPFAGALSASQRDGIYDAFRA